MAKKIKKQSYAWVMSLGESYKQSWLKKHYMHLIGLVPFTVLLGLIAHVSPDFKEFLEAASAIVIGLSCILLFIWAVNGLTE